MRRTKYFRKLYELNDCDVRNMLWYKLKMACRLGVPTDIFEFFKVLLEVPVFKQMPVTGSQWMQSKTWMRGLWGVRLLSRTWPHNEFKLDPQRAQLFRICLVFSLVIVFLIYRLSAVVMCWPWPQAGPSRALGLTCAGFWPEKLNVELQSHFSFTALSLQTIAQTLNKEVGT